MKNSNIDISTFIKQIMKAKNISYREIEERSKGCISYGYVSGLVRGVYNNPSLEKINALANGLGVPEDTVIKVVKGLPLNEKDDPSSIIVEESIRESGMNLTKEEKKNVINIVKKHLKPLVESAVDMVKLTSFALTPATKKALEKVARKEHRSVSSLLEKIIADYFDKEGFALTNDQDLNKENRNKE